MFNFGRSLLSLPRLVVMALTAIVVCAVVPGVASALGLGMGGPAAAPSVAVSSADKDFAGGERRDQARTQRLRTANARVQRIRSRMAHRGLGLDEALALARQTFAEQMTGRLFDGSEPATGLRVVDQRGGGTALVQDTKTGKRALLMSTLPLQAKRSDGVFAPIDLSLQSTASGVGPTNSLAPFRVDPISAASLSFPGTGVSVSVRGGARHTATTASNRAFFANVLPDSDVSVMALPDGAELSILARSPQAPERYVLDVALPEGARLRQAIARDPLPGDPPRSLEIVRGSETLGYVHPPIAIDADGEPVTATMGLDGQDIVLDVSHHDRDVHYPINVDPEIRLYSDYHADWLRWGWTQNRGGGGSFGATKNDCAYYCGLYQSVPTNTTLTNGSYAQWYYTSPANSYIYRTTFGGISHNPLHAFGQNHTRSYMGLLNANASAWESNVNYVNQAGVSGPNPYGPNSGAYYGLEHDFCFNPRCDPKPAAATERNSAIFGFQAQNAFGGTEIKSGGFKGTNTMAWANVYLGDRRAPSLTTATPASRDWTDEPAGTQHTVTVGAHDDGLGIYGIGLDGAASGGGFVRHGCLGHIDHSPCDANWSRDITYTLNEGSNALRFYGDDAVDNRTPGGTWTEKIDRSDPEVELPYVGEGTPSAPEEPEPAVYVAVNDLTFTLQADAKDQYSGVREIRLLDQNGMQIDRKPLSCSPECPQAPATVDLVGSVSQLSETQQYTVEVIDAAGRIARLPVRLIADRIAPPPPSELSLRDYKLGSAAIGWEPEEDPDLSNGLSGSGVALSEYRYRRTLLGTFTGWVGTEETAFELTGLPGELIEVQVRLVDAAGNIGATTTTTMILLPVLEPAPPQQPSGGTNIISILQNFDVRGVLTPRAGTPVVLRSVAGQAYEAETDSGGKVSFRNVPDGDYNVETNYGQQVQAASVQGGVVKEFADTLDYDVTDEEIDFCTENRKQQFLCFYFREDAEKAAHFADRLFTQPEDSSDNTRTNAFKHSFWVAQMVRSIAYEDELFDGADDYPLALEFANAHEARTRKSDDPDLKRATVMDDHNNLLGYRHAVRNSPDSRGKKHNDLFFCNTLRGRNRLAQFARFRKGATNAFSRFVSRDRPVYTRMTHRITREKVRLKQKHEFSNEQPCITP